MTADDVSAFSGPLDRVTSQKQLYRCRMKEVPLVNPQVMGLLVVALLR